ncbi:MAG: sensor histidine kinase N-terminal domain-containing protein [Methylococcales bacterium]|nr:sensor histidine kinase N-terminal domain-containing protein [Methylococcales bacterium]
MINYRSLKTRMLLKLAIPLIFFMTTESVLSYFVTLHYVNSAYDRWLFDSAKSLTQEIKVQKGIVVVELPPAALEVFKWDDMDNTFFKIISSKQGLLAGDPFVPEYMASSIDWSQPVYFYAKIHDERVRVVSMLVTEPNSSELIFVHVAETLNKRFNMMQDILLADLVPQSVLLLLTGFYLFVGVKRGLQPLQTLSDEIAQRSSYDLRPIPDTRVLKEVRTLIDTLNDLLSRLNAAIATQQRFVSNAAHQLRTPLAGLKLQAERALREQDIVAMQPALMYIQESADRMAHLTSQLLLLARAEPSHGSIERVSINLSELVRASCLEWAPKAWQRKIELSFESHHEPVMIKGDAVLLREQLSNLIDNAIAYGHANGNVWIKLQQESGAHLSIIDDGPGIPLPDLEKVFERFYRVAGSAGNGCGLGLAIAKEIADLHQAEIKLSPVSAKGGIRVDLIFA